MKGHGPIRIAYILTPIEFGGTERVSANFLKHVDRTAFDPTVFALLRPWESNNRFLKQIYEEGLDVVKVPVALRRPEEGRDILRVLRCFLHIYRGLGDRKIQAIHTHGYFADTVGIPAARLKGIPSISTCHGFIENDRKLQLYNRIDRLVLRLADRVVAVSSGIQKELVESGLNPKRVIIIPNAVPESPPPEVFQMRRAEIRSKMGLDESSFVLGYVGRLSREKGVHHLIEALGRIPDIPFQAILIGDGADKALLESQVRNQGLGGRVAFPGFQPGVDDWLPAFDLFVLPSLREGTPMALLEAMSYGMPVVATSVGGVPGVIGSGVHGILVPPADPESLAGAIRSLYQDPQQRERLAINAKERVSREYGIGEWTRRMEIEYDALLRERESGGGTG